MFFNKKTSIDADTQIVLTEEGSKEADTMSQAPPYRILQELHSRSPMTVRNISVATEIPVDDVKAWVKRLEKQGYTRVNSGGF